MAYAQHYGAKDSVLAPGGIAGWHLVSTSPTETMANQSIQKDADGHFIEDSLHSGGNRKNITETWKPDGDSAAAPTVTLGDVGNLVALESASLACTGSDRPTLTLTGHVHGSVEDNACKHIGDTKQHTFKMPSNAFGATDPFGGEISGGAEAYEITSSTETAAIDHVDEYGRTGEFLVGCSRGLRVTAHYEATTDHDIAAGDDGDWTITSVAKPTTNEGMVKLTVDGIKYVSTAS